MDGASFIVNKNRIKDFFKAAKDFESILNISQEFAYYKKCFIRDVNNYIIVKTDGSVKRKGAFELADDQLPHKNNSKGIVPLAVDRYVVNNIPVEDTIRNHIRNKNGYDKYLDEKDNTYKYKIKSHGIYDFLIGIKAKRSPVKGLSKYYMQNIKSGNIVFDELQKVNRFYISTTGGKIIKHYENNDTQLVVADKVKQTVVNEILDPFDTKLYDNIDYSWYIKEADKLIREVDPSYKNNTLLLF